MGYPHQFVYMVWTIGGYAVARLPRLARYSNVCPDIVFYHVD